MKYQFVVIAALAAVTLAPVQASAQGKVEASVNFGWTLSDGVQGDGIRARDGNIYDTIDVKDAFNWGFGVGFHASEGAEVGFLFNQQMSTLVVSGTNEVEIGDMKVNNYHPYFAYNFGEEDAKVRPYVMFGLGATSYGAVAYSRAGTNGETDSATKFSTTWGAGVKFMASPKVGIRVGAQWTPTYITTEGEGWWCDPYWGCYVVGDAKYANQFHLQGGIVFKF